MKHKTNKIISGLLALVLSSGSALAMKPWLFTNLKKEQTSQNGNQQNVNNFAHNNQNFVLDNLKNSQALVQQQNTVASYQNAFQTQQQSQGVFVSTGYSESGKKQITIRTNKENIKYLLIKAAEKKNCILSKGGKILAFFEGFLGPDFSGDYKKFMPSPTIYQPQTQNQMYFNNAMEFEQTMHYAFNNGLNLEGYEIKLEVMDMENQNSQQNNFQQTHQLQNVPFQNNNFQTLQNSSFQGNNFQGFQNNNFQGFQNSSFQDNSFQGFQNSNFQGNSFQGFQNSNFQNNNFQGSQNSSFQNNNFQGFQNNNFQNGNFYQ